jgi:hypothetical protein
MLPPGVRYQVAAAVDIASDARRHGFAMEFNDPIEYYMGMANFDDPRACPPVRPLQLSIPLKQKRRKRTRSPSESDSEQEPPVNKRRLGRDGD